jgi:radical SAM family uncharacterized protein
MDNDRLNELLLTVRKPGRYTGGEWNSVRKEWAPERVKVCLAFPDVYEVGMSYLGTKILYGILNGRDDCLCERVFAPWVDFEAVLRNNGMPLFSLETRHALREFDIVGLSLAYELTYTNVLTILDLGGIPLSQSDRTDSDPIVIAGGPSVFNPEPMTQFIDAFVIGDGEEVVGEIVDLYKSSRVREFASSRGNRFNGNSGPVSAERRRAFLRDLANVEGIYVPSLYKVEYNDDGTIKSFAPDGEDVPMQVKKRYVADFENAYYPVKQVVPNIGIVHDRIAIEVMRGCKHACRFCQAASTYRPCRERSAERLAELAKEAYRNTGYDEISLLSLSSADYSQLRRLIDSLNDWFHPKSVSISVPSLRIEDVIKDLPALISKTKKSTLTFAPEAGSQRLRRSVGKDIAIESLFEASAASFRSGWNRVKLYFMIGLPGETDGDILEIADIARKVSDLKRELDGRPAQVSVSVNALVPKPHTGFQREAMDRPDELQRKRALLRSAVKSRQIDVDFHDAGMSRVEAVMARGDRRVSAAILSAWRAGSRFDGWQEFFNATAWDEAFRSCAVDPAFYTLKARPPDEVLPWQFIGV